jgi:hypothetical protein
MSDEHTKLLTGYGKASIYLDHLSEELEVIVYGYAVNGREFDLLGPEIRYFLQFSLCPRDLAILRDSEVCKGKRTALKSDDEKALGRLRIKVKSKVARCFNRMRRDFYPELNVKFTAPAIGEIVEDDAEEAVDFRDDEEDYEDYYDENELVAEELRFEEADVGSIPEPAIVVIPEPAIVVIPEPAIVVIPDQVVAAIPEPSNVVIIDVLFEARAHFVGVVGVANDVSSVIESFLRRIDANYISFIFPVAMPVRFDIFICIPSPELSRSILSAALNHPMRRPFFIYLPLSLLQSDLDLDACRLNLIITTSTHAWFMGYLLGTSGSQFQLRTISA